MDISAIMDVFHNAMRTGLRAKKDTKNRIRVRVLSTPVYTTEREAGALTGLSGKSVHIGEFRFKGRIVEPDWVHNPHLFLDDPCSIENAKDTLATIAAIQCHTTFISTKSANGNQDMPKIDDIVMANFDPNEFSINMERAEYVGMNTESDGSQGPELRSTQQYCQSIADNFKNTATGISNLGDGGTGYTLDDAVCASVYSAFYLTHPLQTEAVVTSPWSTFRKLTNRAHQGVDMRAGVGDDVYAAADGTFDKHANQEKGAGIYIRIKHADNYKTKYFHLSSTGSFESGDSISAGDLIGKSGNTGKPPNGYAPHLHFELWKGANSVDPMPFIKTIQKCGAEAPPAIASADPLTSDTASDDGELGDTTGI